MSALPLNGVPVKRLAGRARGCLDAGADGSQGLVPPLVGQLLEQHARRLDANVCAVKEGTGEAREVRFLT